MGILTCIIWVGLKYNGKYPHKRVAERFDTNRGEVTMTMKAVSLAINQGLLIATRSCKRQGTLGVDSP